MSKNSTICDSKLLGRLRLMNLTYRQIGFDLKEVEPISIDTIRSLMRLMAGWGYDAGLCKRFKGDTIDLEVFREARDKHTDDLLAAAGLITR